MILEFIKQPLVMMFVCALLVFFELCAAKKFAPRFWFTNITKNIQSPETRRGTNVFLGIVISVGLSLGEMAFLCDVFTITWLWEYAIASGFIATFIYVIIEKVFGESKTNELGKIFCEVMSHSTEFDGKLTEKGKRDLATKIAKSIKSIDEAVAAKETKAIDNIVAKFDAFLADGKITADEKAQAQKLVEGINIESYPFFEKYKALLNN